MTGTLTLPEITIQGIPSVTLKQRACVVTVGDTQIKNLGDGQGLNVEFKIKSTLKPNEPNTCDLTIFNLSESTRKAIEQAAQPVTGAKAKVSKKLAGLVAAPDSIVPVQIDAGYVGHMSTLFLGELRAAQTLWDGVTFTVELSTGDGDSALALARVNESIPKGSTASAALSVLLKAMAVGSGNLNSPAIQAALKGTSVYGHGAALKGNAAEHVRDLATSVGLEFSIQGGQAQFLSMGRAIGGDAFEISDTSGMIGTPTVDTKGVLTVSTLLLPGLKCGDPIVMRSRFVQGLYRILSIEVEAETAGKPWYMHLSCGTEGVAP